MSEIDATTELLNELDEIALERAAIIDCESGYYIGRAESLDFGGDK